MMAHRLAERLLLDGLDDWLHLADIAWAAGQFTRDDESQDVVSAATEALAELLDQEFIQIGEVSDGGFFEWDVPNDEAIDRVRRGWRALGREPQPGDVCWVANTALGNRHVHEISNCEVSAREGYLAMVEFLRTSSEVVDVERAAWIDAAKQVLAGQTTGLRCPVCDNDTLDAEWLPLEDGTGGEYRLRCRTCGAENFVLKRRSGSEA